MDNVYKNIGDRHYAFNSMQLATFPHQYKYEKDAISLNINFRWSAQFKMIN